jgi:ABC-type multidrug transport system fused ATPase/permease subunit
MLLIAIKRSLTVFGRKEKRKFFYVLIIQVILASLDLVGVVILGLLGARVISGTANQPTGNRTAEALTLLNLIDKPLRTQVFYLGLIAFIVFSFKTACSLVLTRRSVFFLSRRAAMISSTLVAKLLSQSILVVQKDSYQKTIHTLTYGVSTIAVNILGALIYLVSDVAMLIILILGLFIIDPAISLLTVLMFGSIALLLYKFLNLKIKNLGDQQLDLTIASNEKIEEVLESYRELVVRNRRSYYSEEISSLRMKLANSMALNTFYQNLSKYLLEMTLIFGIVVISVIQFATQSASRAAAVMSIFLAASTRIGPGVMRIQQVALNLKASTAMATPAFDLIDQLKNVEPISGSMEWDKPNYEDFISSISVKDLSFRYPGSSKNAIDSLNLSIPEGSLTAIVGPSGSGKTTLVDLLLGILEPKFGSVLISGFEPQVAISKWPGSISYVPQNTVTVNGTIEENVLLGYKINPKYEQYVDDALEAAELTDFIKNLPLGKKTAVGEKGTKLSGGQRQRIGIARALFTKPKVLVLDEATSSLDSITESKISHAIQELKGAVTVIVIAHRLSTVKFADQVIYMSKGKVEAHGTFEELRRKVPDFDLQANLMGL